VVERRIKQNFESYLCSCRQENDYFENSPPAYPNLWFKVRRVPLFASGQNQMRAVPNPVS